MKSPILIAAAVMLNFASLSAAQAAKVIAKAGVSQEERQRVVRDHRGHNGIRGGGIEVLRHCNRVKGKRCHSH